MFTVSLVFLQCFKKYLLHRALSFRTKVSLTLSKFASCDAQKEFKSWITCVDKNLQGQFSGNFALAGTQTFWWGLVA